MLGINLNNFWLGSDSYPKPTAWERCCPNPTAVIYFWIKRVGSFALKKKEIRPYLMNNFSCMLHILRKIIKKTCFIEWYFIHIYNLRRKMRSSLCTSIWYLSTCSWNASGRAKDQWSIKLENPASPGVLHTDCLDSFEIWFSCLTVFLVNVV